MEDLPATGVRARLQEEEFMNAAMPLATMLPLSGNLDAFTCTLCRKISKTKLPCCGQCKKYAYCDKDCQRKHWKDGHKTDCVPVDELTKEESKILPITWKQLEDFKVAEGNRLEFRICSFDLCVPEEKDYFSAMCYDRARERKPVVYPSALHDQVKTLFLQGHLSIKWKNPKFRKHTFEDGSVGIRITPEDFGNMKMLVEARRG